MTASSTPADWFSNLRQTLPALQLGMKAKAASNSNRHPREAVLELIDASVAVLANPAHTVLRRGEAVKPEVCFSIVGNIASVTLSYCRQPIAMPDGSTALKVPTSDVNTLLAALRGAVAGGAFDTQLEQLKDKRVVALKKGIAAKKSAA